MSRDDREVRLQWVQLTSADVERIRHAAQFLRPHAEEIVKKFYDHSFGFTDFVAKVDQSGSNRTRLESTQLDYFLGILDPSFDDAYFARRKKIGEVHARLDVKPRWNLGEYAVYSGLIYPILAEHLDGQELAATLLRYSERGQAYVEALRKIIRGNGLAPLDDARFSSGQSAPPALGSQTANAGPM